MGRQVFAGVRAKVVNDFDLVLLWVIGAGDRFCMVKSHSVTQERRDFDGVFWIDLNLDPERSDKDYLY